MVINQDVSAPGPPPAGVNISSPTFSKRNVTTQVTVQDGDTIAIGAVVPLTGRYGAGGVQVKNGYELAVADINSAGGVDVGGTKRQLALTVLDDASDATPAVVERQFGYDLGRITWRRQAFPDREPPARS